MIEKLKKRVSITSKEYFMCGTEYYRKESRENQVVIMEALVELLEAKNNAFTSLADSVGRHCPFCGEPCIECSHKSNTDTQK